MTTLDRLHADTRIADEEVAPEHQAQAQQKESKTHTVTPTTLMLRLDCAIQTYAWGKPGLDSAVARLKKEGSQGIGFKVEEDKRYAELWMGTHPSGPSRVVISEGEDHKNHLHNHNHHFSHDEDSKRTVLLKNYLRANPAALGSETESKEGDLPFMFKVLSISKALSIQAHPDKKLAEQLHASRPDVYKDPNHKPEMAISLTKFEALCGFRPLTEILTHLHTYPELRALVSDQAMALLDPLPAKDEEQKQGLRAVFSSYMHAAEEVAAEQVAALASRLSSKDTEELSPLESLILRLYDDFPGDRGLMGPLFLNYVRLGPGKAFVMQANEPHAYLSGDILECMATSDNVVRVGLTPKYRDVETLLNMLTYNSGPMAVTEGEVIVAASEGKGGEHRRFTPPVEIPEFEVETVKLDGGKHAHTHTHTQSMGFAWPAIDGASIVLVLEGKGTAVVEENGKKHLLPLHKGEVYFLSANTGLVLKGEEGGAPLHVTIAHTNFAGRR